MRAQDHRRRWGAHRAAAEVWLSMAAAARMSAVQAPRASATAGYPLTSRTRCCSQAPPGARQCLKTTL